MQLNNTKNGYVIILDKFDLKTKRIVYSLYERLIFDENGNTIKSFLINQTSVILEDVDFNELADNTLSILDNIERKFLISLRDKLEDKDNWIINNDKQNWLFTDRIIRLTILNSFILEELTPLDSNGTLSPMGDIINREKTNNYGYYINKDKVTTIYVLKVDDTDQPIISPYIGKTIWIETKLS